MVNFKSLIQGGIAADSRGHIRFVNDFDMSAVKRFYIIKNNDNELIRGWRAHRKEQRWFCVLSGKFRVHYIQIDNWDEPSKDLAVESLLLFKEDMQVLHFPKGYCTAIHAIEPDSELLVFADSFLEQAAEDDYTYPLDYFLHLDNTSPQL